MALLGDSRHKAIICLHSLNVINKCGFLHTYQGMPCLPWNGPLCPEQGQENPLGSQASPLGRRINPWCTGRDWNIPHIPLSLCSLEEKIYPLLRKEKKTPSGIIQYGKLAELQPSITSQNLHLRVKLNLRKGAISVFLEVTTLPCATPLPTEQLHG